MQASLQKQIAGELEWLQQSAKGQQKKGKARLRRYDDLVEEVRCMSCWLIYHSIYHVICHVVHHAACYMRFDVCQLLVRQAYTPLKLLAMSRSGTCCAGQVFQWQRRVN
jgi:hypothetical protein